MKIKTDSGEISINKQTPKGKATLGFCEYARFTGINTLDNCVTNAVNLAKQLKIPYKKAGQIIALLTPYFDEVLIEDL